MSQDNNVNVLSPIVLPIYPEDLIGARAQEYNIIYGNSKGILTCFSPYGKELWQIRSTITWPSSVPLIDVFYIIFLDWFYTIIN